MTGHSERVSGTCCLVLRVSSITADAKIPGGYPYSVPVVMVDDDGRQIVLTVNMSLNKSTRIY
jgi:hypothetical protein